MNTSTAIIAAGLTGLAVFSLMSVALGALWGYLRGGEEEAVEVGVVGPSVLGKLFGFLSAGLSPFLPDSFRHRVSRSIQRAGGLNGLTVEKFSGGVVGSLGGGLLVAAVVVMVAEGAVGWLILGGVVGGGVPFLWLHDQVAARHQEIISTLPFHLDLLTLCVEAGLDFNAGVSRTVEKGKQGALVEEFQSYLMELRLGKTRSEALLGMSERVGLPALSTFLSALMQADRMGTNLGKTLRVQSEQLRVERFQRAEKAANEAPVKMVLPLVLFIFPTVWIILGGPLIFEWLFK